MAEKLRRTGIKRQQGYLYFIDKKGNVARTRQDGSGGQEVVKRTDITKQSGYLYFLDKDGDISRARMKNA